MRMVLVAVVLALVAAGGCMTAAEKKRTETEDRLSAARIGGKFHHDDPLVAMLAPEEREALHRAGMLQPGPDGELVASKDPDEGDGEGGDDAKKSLPDQAGEVLMSVLSVSVTLGMIAAPYLLF